jgi:1-acyl-sn-glycerol-3-phosphate acyltransferase
MQPRIHWVYYFGRVLIRILAAPFFWWVVKGRENLPEERPVVVCCNHLHIADPPVMAAAIPFKCVFMAKEELWQNKWSRYWVENFGSFPVKRNSFDREAIKMSEAWLASGVSLIMFPEGARSKSSRMQPASPGAALLALRNNIPVVPVGITGTQYIRNLKWAFFHHPKITITIGKPLYPPACDGKPTREQRNQFCDTIMYKIAELLPKKYRGVYDREETPEN